MTELIKHPRFIISPSDFIATLSDKEISQTIAKCNEELKKLKILGDEQLECIHLLKMHCPHNKKETWTNDDGDGPFKVEKCLVCGLQKDGTL